MFQYVLALNLLATLEDAFGEKASRCLPRFFLAAFICAFGCASALIHTTDVGFFTYTAYITKMNNSHAEYFSRYPVS